MKAVSYFLVNGKHYTYEELTALLHEDGVGFTLHFDQLVGSLVPVTLHGNLTEKWGDGKGIKAVLTEAKDSCGQPANEESFEALLADFRAEGAYISPALLGDPVQKPNQTLSENSGSSQENLDYRVNPTTTSAANEDGLAKPTEQVSSEEQTLNPNTTTGISNGQSKETPLQDQPLPVTEHLLSEIKSSLSTVHTVSYTDEDIANALDTVFTYKENPTKFVDRQVRNVRYAKEALKKETRITLGLILLFMLQTLLVPIIPETQLIGGLIPKFLWLAVSSSALLAISVGVAVSAPHDGYTIDYLQALKVHAKSKVVGWGLFAFWATVISAFAYIIQNDGQLTPKLTTYLWLGGQLTTTHVQVFVLTVLALMGLVFAGHYYMISAETKVLRSVFWSMIARRVSETLNDSRVFITSVSQEELKGVLYGSDFII